MNLRRVWTLGPLPDIHKTKLNWVMDMDGSYKSSSPQQMTGLSAINIYAGEINLSIDTKINSSQWL